MNPTGTAISAVAAAGHVGGSSFKLVYLIPVFVIVPLVAVFAILACTYGKYWGRDRNKGPLPGSNGQSSAWWSGGVGSWRRGMHDPDGADEEVGALVSGEKSRMSNGSAYEYNEKRFSLPSNRGGSKWTNVFSIASRSALPYQQTPRDASIPFLSVTGAPTDAPFAPPSRSSSTHDFPNWTSDPYGPNRPPPPQNNGFLSAGVWRMGSQSRRYNPRMGGAKPARGASLQRGVSVRSTDTFGSRLSDKIFGRFGLSAGECPSPSVYSPSPEQSDPQSFGAVGTYMGLQGVDEDEEEDDYLDEKSHRDLDYDAFLAEARVRDGSLAQQYAKGEVSDADLFPSTQGSDENPFEREEARQNYEARTGGPRAGTFGRPATPPFGVDLPAAPSRLQVSPKKTASTLVRTTASDTPERNATANLLFSYASPPVNHGSPRPPLPPVPTQTGSASQDRAPLTDAPARVPFRQQGPPKLAKPVRPTDPFASVIVPSPPLEDQVDERPPSTGSSRPSYQPYGARKSEMSAFSLDAYGALAYSDADEPEEYDRPERPATRRENPKPAAVLKKQRSDRQLEDSVQAGAVDPSASRAAAGQGRAASPTKPRPYSAHAQLGSQTARAESPVKLPTRQDLRPTSSSQPRGVHGFNPSFPDSPELQPLPHPNRVRAAVENLETTQQQGPRSQHRRADSGKSVRSDLTRESSLARSPSKPSTSYRRPVGNKGLDSADEGNSSDDSEAIQVNRRLSRLILNRSKSQTQLAPSPNSAES